MVIGPKHVPRGRPCLVSSALPPPGFGLGGPPWERQGWGALGGLLAPWLCCRVPLCPFGRCCGLAPLAAPAASFRVAVLPFGWGRGPGREGWALAHPPQCWHSPAAGHGRPSSQAAEVGTGAQNPLGIPPPLICDAYPPGQGRHMLRRPWPAPLDIPKNVNSQTVKHPAPGLVCQGIQGAKRRGKMPRRPYLDTIETPAVISPQEKHDNYSHLGLKKAPSDGMI